MSEHFDALETRSADARGAELANALPRQVAHAMANTAHYAALFAGVDAASIRDHAALARLPVTRKSALIEAQAAHPPFGGIVALPMAQLARVFISPGPIHEPEGTSPDYWRFARALHATGFRAGDLVQNCFAYHFTPAGSMMENAARALGCPVFPAGTGNTEAQARAAAQLKPAGYTGTPEFLKAIIEKGDELGLDLGSITRGHVSGGAYLPTLRAWYAARGLTVLQSYGTADLGLIAYESEARDGLISDEGVLIEIVRPGTGGVVADGEVGEVLVTSFNPVHPLIRFATGDLSAILPGTSPCGRTNRRIRGWMGRADQAAKVRGMFVRPEQVAQVLADVPGVLRARLVISADDGRDHMELRAEAPDPAMQLSLEAALKARTRLRGTVVVVGIGSLPNDGKVIDDMRPAAS
ncbi:phenylacetate--CoA ligase family protein [Plastoroseomonas arctica]|uniref:Phenylacetate--CoA ligase n=1 Tax=Plastoroseomonas arctica TaxID=1509237 RepID=A0AAF1JYL8_9PROT|nr:phenylacetate--CoA ligase family protein [Plastoroseomonas arctica]MBR0656797.1 phenylacetate--CoA ligase [Plastoroseomonas arctica]